MKKNLALLLVVAIVFTCLLGFSASAAEYYTVSIVTVPMRATVSVLFAIEILDGNDETINNYKDHEAGEHTGISIYKTVNGEEQSRDMNFEYKGILQMGGKMYWVYEYSNISAAEMENNIRAKVTSTPDSFSVNVSVAQFLRSYAADTNNLEADRTLAEKMLAYGEKAAAWAAAQ